MKTLSSTSGASDTLSELQPIVRQSVNESVYQALRNKLMHGEYRAGQVLGIKYVADALGTSTMPVREALRRLVAQQGLEPMKNGTTRVPLITRERMSDIRRCRKLIEGQVTEWAGPALTTQELDRLDRLAEEITEARRTLDGVSIGLEKNRIFHFTIYAAAQSPVMTALIESLWLQSGTYIRETREKLHTGEDGIDGLHEAAVAAFRRGDFAGARQCIERDVTWAFDRLA